MLQHQAYAACDDEVIRERVRAAYARLVAHVERLSGAEPERIDEFFRYGMWLNVAAAMGVEDLSAGCEWVRAESVRGELRNATARLDQSAGSPAFLVPGQPVVGDRLPGGGARRRTGGTLGRMPGSSSSVPRSWIARAGRRVCDRRRAAAATAPSRSRRRTTSRAPPRPALQARSRSSPATIRNVPGAVRPLA